LVDTATENALRAVGCKGKIGQRDYFILGAQKYYLYECNTNPAFDWYSWRIVIYTSDTHQAKMLPLDLGGDTDIANPHVSLAGRSGSSYRFTLTFFLPSEGIKPGIKATAGECVANTVFTYP
jgi:hypothetical protein